MCETGGARRSWSRGLEKVNKRYKMVAAAGNLGLVMRKLFGIGKPRCLQDGFSFAYLLQVVRIVMRTALLTLNRLEQSRPSTNTKFRPAITAI